MDEERAAAAKTTKENKRLGLGCLSLLVIVVVAAAFQANSTQPSTAPAQTAMVADAPAAVPPAADAPAAVPAPNLHDKRAAAKEWWMKSLIVIGLPYAQIAADANAVKTGNMDPAAMSAAVKKLHVPCEMLERPPTSELDSVADRLGLTCTHIDSMVHDLDHYFEDSSTGAAATVSNDITDVQQLADNARVSMISHYRDWGGDPSTIISLQGFGELGAALGGAGSANSDNQ